MDHLPPCPQVLPAWIPGPIKATFARIAMSKATANLPRACAEAMAAKGQSSSKALFGIRKPKMPYFLSKVQLPT